MKYTANAFNSKAGNQKWRPSFHANFHKLLHNSLADNVSIPALLILCFWLPLQQPLLGLPNVGNRSVKTKPGLLAVNSDAKDGRCLAGVTKARSLWPKAIKVRPRKDTHRYRVLCFVLLIIQNTWIIAPDVLAMGSISLTWHATYSAIPRFLFAEAGLCNREITLLMFCGNMFGVNLMTKRASAKALQKDTKGILLLYALKSCQS